jgi:NitT/TauT family transport system ATP-binding protein
VNPEPPRKDVPGNADDVAVRIDEVSVVFETRTGRQTVLDRVSLDVRAGQFLTIIGPSGCGKTSLLRAIGSLLPPTAGAISIYGVDADQARQERAFSFVFQSSALLEWRDALANVRLPLELYGTPRREAEVMAREFLARVGLSDYAKHFPRQMSGGMQQRVAIARALVTQPRLLLMDEPFAALDEITRGHMNTWLLDVWSSSGATVVFITHNIHEAVLLSDRIVVLAPYPGRIIDDIDVNLPRPRTRQVQESADFIELRRRGERMLEEASAG